MNLTYGKPTDYWEMKIDEQKSIRLKPTEEKSQEKYKVR